MRDQHADRVRDLYTKLKALEELPTKHVSGTPISDHEVEEVVPGLLEDADAALREFREAIDAMQSAKRALTDLRRQMRPDSGDR